MKKIILFLGVPGCDKTKAARILESSFDYDYLSWGEIINKNKKTSSYDGNVQELFSKLTKINQKKSDNKIILEGYPANIKEAKQVIEFASSNDMCVEALVKFNGSLGINVKRRKFRKVCPKCNKEFSVSTNFCPTDEVKLIDKAADSSNEHLESEYYKSLEKLKKAEKYLSDFCQINFAVDANSNIQNVVGCILNGLYLKKSKNHIYHRISSASLDTDYGKFELLSYQSSVDYSYHLALVKGSVYGKNGVLTRVHSSCITGDILFSRHCDCGKQLKKAFSIIDKKGEGLIIYLFQEGRGINIINKIKAYKLQANGLDTVDANLSLGLPSEMRDYEVVKDILEDLNVKSIDLLTNNPDKSTKLKSLGIIVNSNKNHEVKPTETSLRYLKTKKDRMYHSMGKV